MSLTAGFIFGANQDGSDWFVLDFPFTGGGPLDPKTYALVCTVDPV